MPWIGRCLGICGPEAVPARHQLGKCELAIAVCGGSQPLPPDKCHVDPLKAAPPRQHHPPLKAGRGRKRPDLPQVHHSRPRGIGEQLLEDLMANPLLGDGAVTAGMGPVGIGQLPGAGHFVPSVPLAGAALPGAPGPQAKDDLFPITAQDHLGPEQTGCQGQDPQELDEGPPSEKGTLEPAGHGASHSAFVTETIV